MFWLGIDIGTGGSRALLIDSKGKLLHAFTAPHEDMRMEKPFWAEQRPENWWDAAQAAIRGVLKQANASGKEIAGIGLSGQMHGLTLLDESDNVIRPALIWCDQRSQAQVDWINKTATRETVLECTANPVLTGFTLPKLLWVRDNEPREYERVRKILLPKDYVRFKLTGEYASEVSDASGTALFDVVRRRWSLTLAEKLGIDRSILPYVYESPDVSGRCQRAARRKPRDWRPERQWSAGRAIRRQARSATALSSLVWFHARSARPAWYSHTRRSLPTIPKAASTRSVTPFQVRGT